MCAKLEILAHQPEWLKYPNTIQLDTHNYCNLNCEYCNVQRSFNLPYGKMAFSTIREVLEYWRGKGPRHVAPFLNGEPLLEKRLPEICSLAGECGFTCIIDTNGVEYENRELLIHPNLRLVRFTISAATPSTYSKIHGKPYLDKAMKTLAWFLENKLPKQRVWLHFIATRINEHEIGLWNSLHRGIPQTVFPVHHGLGQEDSKRVQGWSIKKPYMIDEHGEKHRLWPNASSPIHPCPCWTIMSIGWNGEIMQCTDFPYKYNYGKVGEVDLQDAWRQRNRNKMDNACCNSCSLRFPTYKKIMDSYVG